MEKAGTYGMGNEMRPCFRAADILLPAEQVDPAAWAVVACDQYTSQPEYWKQVEAITEGKPSALNIIYPEVYLEEGDKRIEKIHRSMEQYLSDGVLIERVHQGFLLVARQISIGVRLGLVGALDLEQYDYKPGTSPLVRATEGTIESRIPPRVRIRNHGLIESPHVMVLIDDDKKQLIESLYERRDSLTKLYDTDLMQNGGHLSGYAIEGRDAAILEEKIGALEQASNGFLLAVGDGNHSLATAKVCWARIRETLTEDERKVHPARYALVEVVNLHSPALVFEPIHRVLFGTDPEQVAAAFKEDLQRNGIGQQDGNDIVFVYGNKQISLALSGANGRLPVDVLQSFLDRYIAEHPDVKIDYVHGEEDLREMSQKPGSCGILLGAIDKNTLFPAIAAGGVLPRKTFSMGEAYEKRYYMECRRIEPIR